MKARGVHKKMEARKARKKTKALKVRKKMEARKVCKKIKAYKVRKKMKARKAHNIYEMRSLLKGSVLQKE